MSHKEFIYYEKNIKLDFHNHTDYKENNSLIPDSLKIYNRWLAPINSLSVGGQKVIVLTFTHTR